MKPAVHVRERDFQAQVLDLARICGWLAYHTYDSRRSAPGFPDLVLVRAPEVRFIELKSQQGRHRPEQRVWLDALGRCSHVDTRLWRPGDWREIQTTLTPEREPERVFSPKLTSSGDVTATDKERRAPRR